MTWMSSKLDEVNIKILLKNNVSEEEVELYEEILSKYQYDVKVLKQKVTSQLRALVKNGIVIK